MGQHFKGLELEVIRWAEARKIIPNSTPLAQARKTLEEAGELLSAAAMMEAADLCRSPFAHSSARRDYQDAIGDVLVTLIIGAALADVDVEACLAQAYAEIKDRKGYLREDGIFVKES